MDLDTWFGYLDPLFRESSAHSTGGNSEFQRPTNALTDLQTLGWLGGILARQKSIKDFKESTTLFSRGADRRRSLGCPEHLTAQGQTRCIAEGRAHAKWPRVPWNTPNLDSLGCTPWPLCARSPAMPYRRRPLESWLSSAGCVAISGTVNLIDDFAAPGEEQP